jgi:cyanate lyase
LARNVPAVEARRAAVARLVNERMRELRISISDLVKRSGVSENIVYDILYRDKSHNKATWIAISAALDWEPGFLVKVIDGQADPSVAPVSPMEKQMAQMFGQLAEVGALRRDVVVLKEVVYRIDKKIDFIINTQRSAVGGG